VARPLQAHDKFVSEVKISRHYFVLMHQYNKKFRYSVKRAPPQLLLFTNTKNIHVYISGETVSLRARQTQ
jgi:hypothetical protein